VYQQTVLLNFKKKVVLKESVLHSQTVTQSNSGVSPSAEDSYIICYLTWWCICR